VEYRHRKIIGDAQSRAVRYDRTNRTSSAQRCECEGNGACRTNPFW
jgi:hypothetical protein